MIFWKDNYYQARFTKILNVKTITEPNCLVIQQPFPQSHQNRNSNSPQHAALGKSWSSTTTLPILLDLWVYFPLWYYLVSWYQYTTIKHYITIYMKNCTYLKEMKNERPHLTTQSQSETLFFPRKTSNNNHSTNAKRTTKLHCFFFNLLSQFSSWS